jgi:hypothetical protein
MRKVLGVRVKGCIYCGNPKLDTLANGRKYCDICKKETVEADISEKGVRH